MVEANTQPQMASIRTEQRRHSDLHHSPRHSRFHRLLGEVQAVGERISGATDSVAGGGYGIGRLKMNVYVASDITSVPSSHPASPNLSTIGIRSFHLPSFSLVTLSTQVLPSSSTYLYSHFCIQPAYNNPP